MTDWPHDPTGPRKPSDAPSEPVQLNGRVPDIYKQLGALEGAIDALRLQVSEAVDRMDRRPCAVHVARLEDHAKRIEHIEDWGSRALAPRVKLLEERVQDGGTARKTKPSEGSEPVKARDLALAVEHTDRIVLDKLKAVDDSLEGRVTAQVTAALRAQRDEERAADERARAERRAAAIDEVAAKDLALSQQLSRWKALIGGAVALVSAAGGVSWCQLSSRQQADTAALTKAVEHRPAPVVVQVPTPVMVPAKKKKEASE